MLWILMSGKDWKKSGTSNIIKLREDLVTSRTEKPCSIYSCPDDWKPDKPLSQCTKIDFYCPHCGFIGKDALKHRDGCPFQVIITY